MTLTKVTAQEEIEPVNYVDLDGQEHVIPGRRFPNGKSIPIIEELLKLAGQINLKEHWSEAQKISRGEQATFDTLVASLGPVPDEDDPKYMDYVQRRAQITFPRGLMNMLLEQLVPDLLQVAQVAPESLFRIAAYATLAAKDLQKADSNGTVDKLLKTRVKQLEWNFDIPALLPVFMALPRLSGLDDFLSRLGVANLPQQPPLTEADSQEGEVMTIPSDE